MLNIFDSKPNAKKKEKKIPSLFFFCWFGPDDKVLPVMSLIEDLFGFPGSDTGELLTYTDTAGTLF